MAKDNTKILGNFRYLVPYDSVEEIIADVDLEPEAFCLLITDGIFNLMAVSEEVKSEEYWVMDNGAFLSKLPVSGEVFSTYTNLTPVPVDIGGIQMGTTFYNAPYKKVFDMLLYPEGAANFEIYTNLSSLSFRKGEIILLTEVELRNIVCVGIYEIVLRVGSWERVDQVEPGTVTHTFLINKEITDNTTIEVIVRGDNEYRRTIEVRFGYPWYFGVVDESFAQTSANIQRLESEIIDHTKNSLEVVNSFSRNCFFVAVPNELEVYQAVDKSNIDNIDNYKSSSVTLFFDTESAIYNTYISNPTSVKNQALTIRAREVE